MKNNRPKLIRNMFDDIALPEEIRKVDEFYNNNEPGLAEIYMLRKIKPHWDSLKKNTTPEDNEIKINYWGDNKHELS